MRERRYYVCHTLDSAVRCLAAAPNLRAEADRGQQKSEPRKSRAFMCPPYMAG